MIKKIGVFVFGFVLFLSLVSLISALSLNVATCGNGIVETGEQCDGGQIRWAGNQNYQALGDLNCPLQTCSCASGNTKDYTFDSGSSCVTLKGCESACATASLPGFSGTCCSQEDLDFDLAHPHCGCGGEPDCRCINPDFMDRYFKCQSCQVPASSNQICYCDNYNLWAQNMISDMPSVCFDPAYNWSCKWSGGGAILEPSCVQWSENVTQPSCTDPALPNACLSVAGNQLSASASTICCNSTSTCDYNLGCVPIPVKKSVPTNVKINIGSGNVNSRNIECSLSFEPEVEGHYSFTFSLEGVNGGSQSFTDDVAFQSCRLQPNPLEHKAIFNNVLTKDSGEIRCVVSYTVPTSNSGTYTNSSYSNYLVDLDKDGFLSKNQLSNKMAQEGRTMKPWHRFDVDDWVFNDTLYGDSTQDYKCLSSASISYDSIINEISKKRANCTIDNNNDGVGDFAACSYCRNPNAAEYTDDVDNDGWGVCQANISRACRVENYKGDGANDLMNIPVTNSTGAVVDYMGCNGMKNRYGVVDNFCQMRDDLVVDYNSDSSTQTDLINDLLSNKSSAGYLRAVKWGERQIDEQTISTNFIGSPSKYIKKVYYDFIPGGISASSVCAIKTVYHPINPGILSGLEAFQGLINYDSNIKNNLYRYHVELFNTGNLLGLQNYPVLVLYQDYPDCKPLFESNGTLNSNLVSSDLPNQFIQSFRGELDFGKFGLSPSILRDRDTQGKFLWQWKVSYVPRDKCNDGSDNNGEVDLYDVAPYGFFLNKVVATKNQVSGVETSIDAELLVPLTDIDDPSCKFSSESDYIVTDQSSLHNYSQDNLKNNPITGNKYCFDQDGDGFCGCKNPILELNNDICAEWAEQNVTSVDPLSGIPYTTTLKKCVVQASRETCNFTKDSNEGIVASKQFPDCKDNPTTNYFSVINNGNPVNFINATLALGWGLNNSQPITSWNVHPLAPVNTKTCSIGKYDFDCNKGGKSGQDLKQLREGKTPFDMDTATGIEYIDNNKVVIDDNVDYVCFGNTPYRQIAIDVGVSLAMIPLSFVPVAGIFFTAISIPTAIYDTWTFKDECFVNNNNTWSLPCIIQKSTSIAVGTFFVFKGAYVYSNQPAGLSTSYRASRAYSAVFNPVSKEVKYKPVNPAPESIASKKTVLNSKGESVEGVARPGCFLNNTLIMMADGSYKNIADVKLGDEIVAFDLNTQKAVNSSVTYTFARNETKYRVVSYEEVE